MGEINNPNEQYILEQMEKVDYYRSNGQNDLAFKLIKELAQNSAYAKYYLGEMYFHGDGTKKNYKKAFQCFLEAEKHGCDYALESIGICYSNGQGVEKNHDLAISYFERAVQTGSVNALICMEQYKAKGKVRDIPEESYNIVLKEGYPRQLLLLGLEYMKGNNITKDYNKAVMFISAAAKKGDKIAIDKLGAMYEKGFIVEQDIKKAFDLIKQLEGENEAVYEWLAVLSLKMGDYKSAKSYFIQSYEGVFERDEYYLEIFKNLNGREIISIENTSELDNDDIDENKIGAVFINPKINSRFDRNTLYNVDDYIRCKKIINSILQDVDMVNETKDNELEVFMQIYVKLGQIIKYNKTLHLYDFNDKKWYYIYRNLIGGLTQQQSVCAGIAEILRNALAERGIECRCISGDEHAYNQVKINGKWYYVDLTFDRNPICLKEDLENCLKSEKSFVEIDPSHINRDDDFQKIEESPEDYPIEKVDEIYRKVLKKYSDDDKVKDAIKNTELQIAPTVSAYNLLKEIFGDNYIQDDDERRQ